MKGFDKKIALWFSKEGGEMTDSDFVQFDNKSTVEIMSALETAQNAYYDLLLAANLIPKQPKAEMDPNLLGILQTLSDNQKSAVEAQKQAIEAQKSSNKTHKRKEMEMPRFDSSQFRHDPMSFKSFLLKFEIYTKDCETDADRLSYLQTACRGDAHHLISKFTLSNENYVIALDFLKNHYMNSERILDKLLTKVTKFSIPTPNKDFSNFSSTMISLKVYLEELKTEHKLDFTKGEAEKLIAHIVHHSMPAIILDEY